MLAKLAVVPFWNSKRIYEPRPDKGSAMNSPISQWNYPTQIWVGEGRVKVVGDGAASLGMSRVLLVIDDALSHEPWAVQVIEQLQASHHAVVKRDVPGNPTGADVAAGCDLIVESSLDGVIAIGGGSVVDAAKAMALTAYQTLILWDLEDVGDHWRRADRRRILPVIAVPTTAGTGSEVGRVAVITKSDEHRKVLIFHPDLPANLVILDPICVAGLPPHLTAATGMDALSHCLEAWCAPGFHPMADGIALGGMKLIKRSLETCFRHGDDLSARTDMLTASLMGATAFQKGLGAMHALAHPLGARYGFHHGLLNAILMPYVLAHNAQGIEGRLGELASALDFGDRWSDLQAGILALRSNLNIPDRLHDSVSAPIDRDWVASQAVLDPSAASNPRQLTTEEYRAILDSALDSD